MRAGDEILLEAGRIITREQWREWLRHPVTRAVALVAAAELAHQLVLYWGIRSLLREEGQ